MPDDGAPLADDAFIRAGEYSLGVLEGAELADARRAILSDRRFSDAVEWWDYRLGSMSEAVGSYIPSTSVWPAILARIDAIDGSLLDQPRQIARAKSSPWNIAALLAGASMAVAGLVFFVATPRTVVLPGEPAAISPAGSQLIAQLQDEASGRRLAGLVDSERNRLALNITGLEAAPGKTPELWVIPAGGAPVSLGAIPQSGSFDRDLSGEEAQLLAAGATLAVTFEDDTGLRHETPTMPILLAGTLDQV